MGLQQLGEPWSEVVAELSPRSYPDVSPDGLAHTGSVYSLNIAVHARKNRFFFVSASLQK
jgi:hypothetical protein